MASLTYEISGGGVTVAVTITEQDGKLVFDLAVQGGTGTIGDLNALFLDIADESLIDGLTANGSDVTGTAFKEDGVTKIDNFTNVNGEVVKDLGKFDLGVQFGTQGMAADDIQTTSFTLDHETQDLSLDDFMLMDSALRLTSVGEIDGAREDSLKLGGTVDGIVTEEPTDGEGPIVGEEPTDGEGPIIGEEPTDGEGPIVGEEPTEGEGPIIEGPIIDEELPIGEEPILDAGIPESEGTIGDEFIFEDVPAEEEIIYGGPIEEDIFYGEPVIVTEPVPTEFDEFILSVDGTFDAAIEEPIL